MGMKSHYAPLVKKIKERTAYWERLLNPRWIRVSHSFIESLHDEDNHTIADTEAYWQYRHARIRWFLPAVIRLDDADLDECIVHEYVHVLLSPVEGRIPAKYGEQSEFAVESLAQAIIHVHDAARKT